MSRMNYEEAKIFTKENQSSFGFNFFSLKDRESKEVRFLYDSVENAEVYSVHSVKIGEKTKSVDCIRAINEPVQKCPFCESGMRARPRVYIPLVDKEGNVYIWERASSFLEDLEAHHQRYGKGHKLSDLVFEISRKGQGLDTKYTIFYVDCVPPSSELPEVPVIEGKLLLKKSADEMKVYVNTGNFPEVNTPENSSVVRRDETESVNSTSKRTAW